MEGAPKQLGELENFYLHMEDSEDIGKMSRGLIEYGAGLMWEHVDEEMVNLIIRYENADYKIPFMKEDEGLHTLIEYLPVYHIELLEGLKYVVDKLGGSALYTSFVDIDDEVSVLVKVGKGETIEFEEYDFEEDDLEGSEGDREELFDKAAVRNEVKQAFNYMEMDMLLEELSVAVNKGRYKGRAEDIRGYEKTLGILREKMEIRE